MALDREKVLQAALRFAEKKKYDKAIIEYRRLLAEDPSDTRTLLKVGDLQSRMADHAGAIATYDQVATKYAEGGFFLKAIAVYKQIREILKKHAPELAPRYVYITPRLARIYEQLNLVSDALTAWDEVATQLQAAGKERDALEAFKKTVELDPMNPLPHLRLAEACCKLQELDSAIESFWTAAELLLGMKRPDDALKVIERILHFRPEPRYARASAELLLKRGTKEAGLQALARLNTAFQANGADLDTLALLAQAFSLIDEPDKARAVHVEMARLAKEQNNAQLWQQIVAHLSAVAPTSPDVVALIQAGPPKAGPSVAPPSRAPSIPAPAPALPPPRYVSSAPPSVEAEAIDLDEDVEYLDDDDIESRGPESIPVGGDDSVLVGDTAHIPVEESRPPTSFVPSAHAHKAIVDAESFRRLGLLDKAVEALHIALEIDPNSVVIRQKLREILVDAGERDPAIQETLNIAIIHLHNQEPGLAEPLALEVLEIEPEHAGAQEILAHVQAMRELEALQPADGHLDTFDVEGVAVSRAIGDGEPLPSFELDEDGTDRTSRPESNFPESVAPRSRGLGGGPGSFARMPALDAPFSVSDGIPRSKRPSPEAIEEVLEEAEFFASQGLYSDAEAILADLLVHAPGHVLLKERLAEVRSHLHALGADAPPRSVRPPEDRAFDIAAALDALDELDETPDPKVAGATEEVDVETVFAKFKEGVKATVAETDAATHYDLGLAYKEMGLLSDAIGEFELAGRDPKRMATCYAMAGMVHKQLGALPAASAAYEKALTATGLGKEEEKSLLYDLALTREALGDRKGTLARLERIFQLDPAYRDVAARIRTLGGALPQAGDDDADVDAAFDNLFG